MTPWVGGWAEREGKGGWAVCEVWADRWALRERVRGWVQREGKGMGGDRG